jgi:hypothetical protein
MSAVEHPFDPEEVMAYLDGELPDTRAVFVKAHLAQCVACQEIVGELRGVSEGLSRWHVGQPPAMKAPGGAQPRRIPKSFFAWTRPVVVQSVAAAAFVTVVAMIWIGTASRSGSPVRSASARTSEGSTVAASAGPPAPGTAEALELRQGPQVPGPNPTRSSRIIRTVSLSILAKDIDAVRPAIDRILQTLSGFVGSIQVSGARNEPRAIRASLRVPSARLDEAVTSLRTLGQVTDETQSGDDVTEQLVDIGARLANGRNTEKRLTEVLKNRTGKVSDVLEVEREIARVRGEIEQLDAQRTNLEQRVTYATVSLVVSEERQAKLDTGALPLITQLRNALIDGLQRAYESAVATLLVLLRAAPGLLFWVAVLWWPVRKAFVAFQGAAKPTASGS